VCFVLPCMCRRTRNITVGWAGSAGENSTNTRWTGLPTDAELSLGAADPSKAEYEMRHYHSLQDVIRRPSDQPKRRDER